MLPHMPGHAASFCHHGNRAVYERRWRKKYHHLTFTSNQQDNNIIKMMMKSASSAPQGRVNNVTSRVRAVNTTHKQRCNVLSITSTINRTLGLHCYVVYYIV